LAEGFNIRIEREFLIAISAAILFACLGAAAVYFGFYFYNDINSLRKVGIVTEGVILRYEKRKPQDKSRKDDLYVPVVQFDTEEGKTIVVEGKVEKNKVLQNICESGERVEVIYDPNNPEHAVINTFAELWFAPLLLWVIGAGFIIVPPFTIWKYYRGKYKSKL